MNREDWLAQLTDDLRLLFLDIGKPLPEVIHVSVGWPSKGGTSRSKRVIGQCWDAVASKDSSPHIFISPVLEDVYDIAATLVHELCHISTPGHKGDFKAMMKLVGLAGKATATVAGPELTLRLKDMVAKLPEFPHSPLALNAGAAKEKPQSTRMIKLLCEEHQEFLVRASRKVITLGLPKCGQCGEPMKESA